MTAAIPIDPRIRARRVAVLRAQGRRRLHLLLALVGLIALGGGAWGLTRSPALDVDHVRLQGLDPRLTDSVLAAAGVSTGTPMLDVDTAEVAGRIETLAWVESAAVRRDWPGTVRIEVTERTPVAVVPDGAGVALVDAAGYVIGRDPLPTGPAAVDLPVIAAPLDVELGVALVDAAPALAVVEVLPDDLHPWVEAITVSGRDLGLDLVGGSTVVLGEPVLLADKVAAVRAVLSGVELECLSTIDVTMADQATVRREPGCVAPVEPGPADG